MSMLWHFSGTLQRTVLSRWLWENASDHGKARPRPLISAPVTSLPEQMSPTTTTFCQQKMPWVRSAAGWHSWLCTGHWIAQLALQQIPGSTACSVLDDRWHSWLCTGPWMAQLALWWILGSTAGSAPTPSSPAPRHHALPGLTPRSWSHRGNWGALLPSWPH